VDWSVHAKKVLCKLSFQVVNNNLKMNLDYISTVYRVGGFNGIFGGAGSRGPGLSETSTMVASAVFGGWSRGWRFGGW